MSMRPNPNGVSEQPWRGACTRLLVASVMDGRSVWSDPYEPGGCSRWADVPGGRRRAGVVPSTSSDVPPGDHRRRGSPLTGSNSTGRRLAALTTWAKALKGKSAIAHPATPAPSVPESPSGRRGRDQGFQRGGAGRLAGRTLHLPPFANHHHREPPPDFRGSPAPGVCSARARSTRSSTTPRSTD